MLHLNKQLILFLIIAVCKYGCLSTIKMQTSYVMIQCLEAHQDQDSLAEQGISKNIYI